MPEVKRDNGVIYRKNLDQLHRFVSWFARTLHLSHEQVLILLLNFVILILGHLTYLGTIPFRNSISDNYFTQKRNLVNTLFVKKGWGWTIVVYVLTFLHNSKRQRKDLRQSLVRVSLVTASWYLVTQWFFGMSIIDRIFTLSGGQCVVEEVSTLVSSSMHCRRIKGEWTGGFDPSGHVFLLNTSMCLLLFEIIYSGELTRWDWPTVALCGLWEWMFYMTCIHFHNLVEKLFGYALSVGSISIVYGLVT
ncbi:unnamed protein product [Kuraishia capsulata CBS 1993]|uniref:FIT family protein scs3 n=1 Tax=Kuraishia capsulata CBS 1993 TaxID=1382522 RepID=W6MM35_9ASCO|nr:uncharacterized protein KUCA_T00001933001 [Kuraishia capsulata CBS 1993]CDK25962.1 unnamed protein product [Kuraishia capsulata CBS 1993]